MLVLQRKVGERIICRLEDGREIVFLLVRLCSGQQARIGIEAPRTVTILREELITEGRDQPKAVSKQPAV